MSPLGVMLSIIFGALVVGLLVLAAWRTIGYIATLNATRKPGPRTLPAAAGTRRRYLRCDHRDRRRACLARAAGQDARMPPGIP